MTAHPMPCPWNVKDGEGKRVYCEVGPKGHDGTHCGGRPRWEYLSLLRAARQKDAA